MTPEGDYREYLRIVWISARVAEVHKHMDEDFELIKSRMATISRWQRIKNWMKRRFK